MTTTSTTDNNTTTNTTTTTVEQQEQSLNIEVPLKLHILQIIKQKQQENGLKHGLDYEAYRRYCTNRLRRLRIKLNLKFKKDFKFNNIKQKKNKKNIKDTTTNPSTTIDNTTTNGNNTTTVNNEEDTSLKGIKSSKLYDFKHLNLLLQQSYQQQLENLKKLNEFKIKNKLERNFIENQFKQLKSSKNLQEFYKTLEKPNITKEDIEKEMSKLSDNNNTIFGDDRYLQFILFQSERNWSLAMHLKNEIQNSPSNSRIKHHQIRKLQKSVKWSKLLFDYCKVFCKDDSRTLLECEAYYFNLLGNLNLEKENYILGYKYLNISKNRIENLFKVLNVHSINSNIYEKQISDLEINIRFCEYHLKKKNINLENINLEKDTNLENLTNKLTNELKKQEQINTLQWNDLTIEIPNIEKLKLNLKTIQSLHEQLNNNNSLFDKLIILYNETLKLIKENLLQKNNLQNLKNLYNYLNFNLSKLNIDKNINMLQKKNKLIPNEVIKIIDNILQNIFDSLELLSNYSNNNNNQDFTYLENLKQYFKAYRCYYLTNIYLNLENKFNESLLLLKRTEEYFNLLNLDICKNLPTKNDVLNEVKRNLIIVKANQLKNISNLGNSSILKLEELKLEKERELQKINNYFNIPLEKHLNDIMLLPYLNNDNKEMDELVLDKLKELKIIEFPPKFEHIPNKPVFFDVASSLVMNYPLDEINNELEALEKAGVGVEKKEEEKKEEPKKKGWFGLW
ncbi:hypothetical protein ABK040_006168 [Willaertia magna]